MNAPILFMPVSQDRAVAELAAAILEDGASASVVAPEGAGKTTLLDRLAPELAGRHARVVRVACPATDGLSLQAFLSQVVGRAERGVLSDEDLEQASDALTQTDTNCNLIALLVDDAHGLLPPALRYIQLACRSGPMLRVVLAGQPGTLELLRGDEFAFLRQRINRNIQLRPLSATMTQLPAPRDEAPLAPVPVVDVAASPPHPVRRRNGAAWGLAGLGVAASVALGLLVARQDEPLAHLFTAVAPESAPAPDRLAGPAETPPGPVLADASPATPEPALPEIAGPAALAEAIPTALAETKPIPASESATPREAAALQLQPAAEPLATLTEVTPLTPERAMADASPASEAAATFAEPAIAPLEEEPALADASLDIESATPREAAALQFQPAPEPPATLTEVTPLTPERAMADASPVPDAAATIAEAATSPLEEEPVLADASLDIESATPREAAALQFQPVPAVPAALAEATPPTPEPALADASPAPEPPATIAEAAITPLEEEPALVDASRDAEPPISEPVIADVAPSQEPVVAHAAPAAEPAAVAAEIPAESSPSVADASPAPAPRSDSPAPAVASPPTIVAPSGLAPDPVETEPVVASLPVPPIPVPAPASAVIAVPEAPRRAPKPARAGPERVAAYDGRTDERRCRDIVMRAQLGEDITNADRQFLRAGCRAGR